jgi:hypothetical protein
VLHPQLGDSQGGWTEVAGTDLKAGEPVIVEGGYNLPEKTAVKLSDDAAKPEEPTEADAKEKAEADGKEHGEHGTGATKGAES